MHFKNNSNKWSKMTYSWSSEDESHFVFEWTLSFPPLPPFVTREGACQKIRGFIYAVLAFCLCITAYDHLAWHFHILPQEGLKAISPLHSAWISMYISNSVWCCVYRLCTRVLSLPCPCVQAVFPLNVPDQSVSPKQNGGRSHAKGQHQPPLRVFVVRLCSALWQMC